MERKALEGKRTHVYEDEQMRKCFPEGSLLVSHKKAPNLKQILVDQRYNNRNKASNSIGALETTEEKGIFLCGKKCQMSQNKHLIPGNIFAVRSQTKITK